LFNQLDSLYEDSLVTPNAWLFWELFSRSFWSLHDSLLISCFEELFSALFSNTVNQTMQKYSKHYPQPVWTSSTEMFQTLSRTCLDSTLINKQMDYYICVCYHQNIKLHKDGFNKFPLFDDNKVNDHIDIKGKNKLVSK